MEFLPVSKEEMNQLGWQQPDFIYISGDAYVDHPSFGAAIISRTLQAHGYKVAFLAQPNWKTDDDFLKLGTPKYGFLISAGNIDSMVNHYSVNRKRRKVDEYSNNGEIGKRPDRATIVYTQMIRRLFPNVPVIIGGIEASLRRLAHYDYWDDKVRSSILIDSQADLLLYGMGENCIIEVADALASGLAIEHITYIRGTVYKTKNIDYLSDYIMLPTYQEVSNPKKKEKYAESFKIQYQNRDAINSNILVENYGSWYVVQNTPPLPLTRQEMDDTYELPYCRTFHPMYQHIPAIEEVQHSIISNRGCFGSCAFCALTSHQGRVITSRSKESIVREGIRITESEGFKGYIHDVGGPTANFYPTSCQKQLEHGTCIERECLHPKACPNLTVSHREYLEILRELRVLPKVKKVFVRSGIRYDYLMYDSDETFFNELVEHHISGQLKVAPEHISNKVLDVMGKPRRELYEAFVQKYQTINQKHNKNQYLVPYLMSSHPGSDLNAAIELALYLKKIKHTPKQVQDFYPTPATLATCMYYTELDPLTMKKIYVAKKMQDKVYQRVLIQYSYPQNYELVVQALKKAGREDLIGHGSHCLVKPRKTKPYSKTKERRRST